MKNVVYKIPLGGRAKPLVGHSLVPLPPDEHLSTKFIECIPDCFLFQNVKEPIRFRSDNVPSLLDLIFTNGFKSVNTAKTGKNDHVISNFNF